MSRGRVSTIASRPQMYPRLDEWGTVRTETDPEASSSPTSRDDSNSSPTARFHAIHHAVKSLTQSLTRRTLGAVNDGEMAPNRLVQLITFLSSWRIRHAFAIPVRSSPRKMRTYRGCRFSNCMGGWRCLYLCVCRILIEMADVIFSSSWRILEPYGRAVQRLAQDKTVGPSGACRVNRWLVINMPFRLDKIA
jgi:hypothetical protein